MKKRVQSILVISLIPFFNLVAQPYYPIPDSAVSWREHYFLSQPPNFGSCEYQYYAEGDTLFQSQHYIKIFRTSSCNGSPGGHTELVHEFIGGLRNDSAKHVYFYEPTQNVELLYYDFNNIIIGQPLPLTALTTNSSEIVSSIDSVFVNGNYHKRYWLHDTTNVNFSDDQLIEGVGSSFGIVGAIYSRFESGNFLDCFYSTDSIRIDTSAFSSPCPVVPLGIQTPEFENEVSISPNPSTGICAVKIEENFLFENYQWKLSDYYGRTIAVGAFPNERIVTLDFSLQPVGIYFLFLQKYDKQLPPLKVIIAK